MKKTYEKPRAKYINFEYDEQVVATSAKCGVHSTVYTNTDSIACVLQEVTKALVFDGACTFYNEEYQ